MPQRSPDHDQAPPFGGLEPPTGSIARPSPDAAGRRASKSLAPDRFVFERVVGEGAFGTVHKVYDKTLETSVAVKYLRALEPSALFRFKSEFRSIVHLVHPNLLQHHELISVDDAWMLTMEFVDGPDFLEYVRPPAKYGTGGDTEAATATIVLPPDLSSGAPPPPVTTLHEGLGIALDEADEQRLRGALRQLAEGLHALHREDRLHRDLKQENVLVSRADGRVVICDFGFTLEGARDPGLAGDDAAVGRFDQGKEPAGTLVYMSPEQARAQELTPASDWYSVGVMLYQALTGRFPFDPREGYGAALQQKLHVRPPSPVAVAPGTPEDLAALALALLHADPSLRAGYARVVQLLDGARATRDGSAREKRALLGRAAERALLEEAFAKSRLGTPALALVFGRSGLGKSTLVAHFLAALERDQRALVFRARCYEREELPYKALDPLIDALSSYLMKQPQAALAKMLPNELPYLSALFPALNRVPAMGVLAEPVAVMDPRERKRLAFRALRELCRSLARTRPIVIFVDDLQWGDVDSAPLFQDLLAPPDAPPIMIVCSYRDELSARIPLLKLLHDEHALDRSTIHLVDIPLAPLSLEAATELATSLLCGPAQRETAMVIATEAEGNPFYIHELAAYTRTHGVEAAIDVRFDALVERQIEALPAESRTLLSVAAVAGYPLPREILQSASSVGAKLFGALRLLEVQRLVAIDRSTDGEQIECSHDRIRETVCRVLDETKTRRIHRALGHALERAGSDDCEALLEHFRGAGEGDKARTYARRGAERAAQALAFARAADLYREALSLSPQDAPEARALRAQLGKMLAFAGRGAEAAKVFLALVPDASHTEALHYRMLATTQFLRGGRLAEGFGELQRADNLFGVRWPASTAQALAMALVRKLRIRFREHRLKLIPNAHETPTRKAHLDALWEVAAAVSCADFIRGSVYGAELSLRTMRACDPSHVAGACGLEAVASAAANDPERVERMLAVADAAARESGELHIQGRAIGMKAVCRVLEGRWRESVEHARASQALQVRSAHLGWDHAIMIWWEMMGSSALGDLRDVTVKVPEALRAAEARGDVYVATGCRTHRCSWAWLAQDRPDAAEYQREVAEKAWNPTGYQFQHWHMTYAQAEIELYRGSAIAAHERLTREWRCAAVTRVVQNVRVDVLFTRARLSLSRALQRPEPKLQKCAVRDGHALVREGRPYAVALGHLVLGTAASFSDRPSAIRLLSLAEAELLQADMRLHHEVARVRRGELLGGDEGQQLIDLGLAAIQDLGAKRPEAFVQMLAPIARIRP